MNEFSNLGARRFECFRHSLVPDTLQPEMGSGNALGADSRWVWALRSLAFGFAVLAAVQVVGGIIRRDALGALFLGHVTGAALSLVAYGAISALLSTDKCMKLGLVLAGSLGATSFLSAIPYIWPQLYASITGLFGVRVYAVALGPGARYLKPIAVLHLALVVTAAMAYLTMERKPADWRLLLWGIVIAVLYIAGVRLLVGEMMSHFPLH